MLSSESFLQCSKTIYWRKVTTLLKCWGNIIFGTFLETSAVIKVCFPTLLERCWTWTVQLTPAIMVGFTAWSECWGNVVLGTFLQCSSNVCCNKGLFPNVIRTLRKHYPWNIYSKDGWLQNLIRRTRERLFLEHIYLICYIKKQNQTN